MPPRVVSVARTWLPSASTRAARIARRHGDPAACTVTSPTKHHPIVGEDFGSTPDASGIRTALGWSCCLGA
jgi:hypothetical protein